MALTRGFTDEIKGLNAEPITGSPVLELLDDTLHRLAQHIDSPVRLYASATADQYLNIGANTVEAGDGAAKVTPPIYDYIPSFTGATIGFQAKTATATLKIDGAAFSFPASTVGKVRRLAFALMADGSIACRWSDEAVDMPALELASNAGTLLATLDGLPIGYIDLECTGVTGQFKTVASATNVIENKVGVNKRIFRFGAGGGGGGGAGDKSFKVGSITADGMLTIKGGTIALSSGLLLATYDGLGTTEGDFQKDLVFDVDGLVTAVDSTTYYLYLDLYSLPAQVTLTDSGRKLVPITVSNFRVTTQAFDTVDLWRYARIGVIRRGVSVWLTTVAVTYPTKRVNDLTAAVSPTMFAVEQLIGNPGGVRKELVDVNFPSATWAAGQIAMFSLADTSDFYGLHPLTNNGSALFSGQGVLGVINTCLLLNGSSQFLSSVESHFDPGDTDFTAGGWFYPTSWSEVTQRILFSNWNSAGTTARSYLVSMTSGVLSATFSRDGGIVNVTTAQWNVAALIGWHHIAVRYTASTNTIDLFIDGSPVSSASGASGLWPASSGIGGPKFNIGSSNSGGDGLYFAGLVDEFFFANGDAFTNAELIAVTLQPQLSAGHVLTSASFPSVAYAAAMVAFYGLSDTLDGNGAHNLINPNTAPFDGTGITGVANSCARLASASSHYFSSTETHFDPGDTDFTVGGWFLPALWKPATNKALFSCGNTTSVDYVHLDLVATTGDLLLTAYTTGAESKTFAYGLGSGWVHIALRYVAATNTFTLFVNGISKGDMVLTTNLGSIGATRRFVLGANAALAQFWDGLIDEFFFANGDAFTSDEILKVYAAKITHNLYLANSRQGWTGTVSLGDFTQQLTDFVVDMDQNSVYVDLSGQVADGSAYIAVQSRGFNGSIATTMSKMFEGTAAYIDSLGTFSHGLLGIPTSLKLLVDVGAGFWETQDASSYFKVSLTQIAPLGGSNLTAILGGSTNVKLLASVGPSAVYSQPVLAWRTAIKTSAYVMGVGDEIVSDSTGGSFTLTLPAIANLGDRIRVIDRLGTWVTYPVTVGRSGNSINGSATDLICNVANRRVELIFDGINNWMVVLS